MERILFSCKKHLTTALIFGLATVVFTVTGCSERDVDEVLVISNIEGYSFNDQRDLFEFNVLVVRNGKVLETGAADLTHKYPNARHIDGAGKTLLPGIIDAHGHVSSLGYALSRVDLRNSISAQSAAETVGSFATDNSQLNWIRGRGWNHVLWPSKQLPTAADLDFFVKDKPVWLERIDGHAGWANSKALELAGIDGNTPSPPGGEIILDEEGNPTGVLIDNAMNLVASLISQPDENEIALSLDAASKRLLSLGITSVHDAGTSASEHKLYAKMGDSGDLPIRIYAMISSTDPQLEEILMSGHSEDIYNLYSARSVKVYTDGALGSHGAAMLNPYSDRPNHNGLLLTSNEDLRDLLKLTTANDFQVGIHAIGDKGNRVALDQIEETYAVMGGRHLRHRIEHAQVVATKDIPRFKELEVIPSMQPVHATSDKNMAEDRIGALRLIGAYAWRTFLDQGSIIASGSDFPVEYANPFFGIHAAVTRQDHSNQPQNGWRSEQSMTIDEALRSFTLDAAWAAHQEKELGGLTRGKWADFILIDRNIFEVAPEDLWKTRVLQTWLAGQLVYQSPKP
jgi:predicted amidohydrolase YtcJ